jgi:hypothetical protein
MLSRKMKEGDHFREIGKELKVVSEPARATSMFGFKTATTVFF